MTTPPGGIQVQLLIGTVPRPTPARIADAVERVEVSESVNGAAAFQIVLRAGRTTPARTDDSVMSHPGLAPFSRIVILVRQGATATVLFDGVITHRQLVRDGSGGSGAVAVTGEDISMLMDVEERVVAHPAMSEAAIALKLLGRYASYGVVPRVVPAALADQPLPDQRVPVQHGSDLAYLRLMATRVHHVFVIRPGPAPQASIAYWGPATGLAGRPLPPLSTDTGSAADVLGISFEDDALTPVRVTGTVTDARTNLAFPIVAVPPLVSPLAGRPALPRRTVLTERTGGLTAAAARGRAQAVADFSGEAVVAASGELDVTRYGSSLQPHRVVGVRGAGVSFDGLYRVETVTHVLDRGRYLQRFRLVRPGVGTTTAVLPSVAAARR